MTSACRRVTTGDIALSWIQSVVIIRSECADQKYLALYWWHEQKQLQPGFSRSTKRLLNIDVCKTRSSPRLKSDHVADNRLTVTWIIECDVWIFYRLPALFASIASSRKAIEPTEISGPPDAIVLGGSELQVARHGIGRTSTGPRRLRSTRRSSKRGTVKTDGRMDGRTNRQTDRLTCGLYVI